MFTGLIEAVGRLVDQAPILNGSRIRVASSIARELSLGDSIAVNGVCLTATDVDSDGFAADVGPETLRVTTIGRLTSGARLNLERPLRGDGRLGGHFVQGHVDGIGQVEQVRLDSEFKWCTVGFPADLAPYIVHKGSIAVDGISLTVASLDRTRFDVQIVPYTLEHTNLSAVAPGDHVNLETDIIGKYVVRSAELMLGR
jgi:riboflavin synthase